MDDEVGGGGQCRPRRRAGFQPSCAQHQPRMPSWSSAHMGERSGSAHSTPLRPAYSTIPSPSQHSPLAAQPHLHRTTLPALRLLSFSCFRSFARASVLLLLLSLSRPPAGLRAGACAASGSGRGSGGRGLCCARVDVRGFLACSPFGAFGCPCPVCPCSPLREREGGRYGDVDVNVDVC